MKAAFWTSLLLAIYTFLGYPLVLWIISKLKPRPALPSPEREKQAAPSVSLILVVRNEARNILRRIENLLQGSCDGLLEIIVVCDGCTDDTAGLIRGIHPLVTILETPAGGKAAGLNLGISRAKGDIIVFTDARQTFDSNTIPRLAAHFSNPEVGAVSGNLEIENSSAGAGQGLDAYWRLEKATRRLEAQIDSSIGCTGAVYAVRRSLVEPIPEDILLDDVVLPMQVSLKGYRVLFDVHAKAFEPQVLDPAIERHRKLRTLRGNFQLLFRYPGWLLPWNCRLWWQLLSHKYLRLAGPVFLTVCLVSSIWLSQTSQFYRGAWIFQSVCLILAAIGLTLPKGSLKVFSIPAAFLFLQWNCVRAFFSFVSATAGRQNRRETRW